MKNVLFVCSLILFIGCHTRPVSSDMVSATIEDVRVMKREKIEKKLVTVEVDKSHVVVKTDDGQKLRWHFNAYHNASEASTYKIGDRVTLIKYVFPGEGNVKYLWPKMGHYKQYAEKIP